MVGHGKYAYLWIGNSKSFLGYIDNTPELRKFIRGALTRLTATPVKRKRKVTK
jgi:hypothetical protein